MAAVLHSRISPLRVSAAPRRIGLVVVVAMHLLLLIALISYAPARNALLSAAPIMVEFIKPPEIEKPKPPPPTEPPKPKPVVKRVERMVEPPPILTAPAEAPSPIVAPPPPPPAPLAPIAVVAPPAPAPPAPAPMTQPIFNADYLDNPSPAYPPVSRRNGEQGRVLLRVLVSAKGTAEEIQIRTSSGFATLDESARATVMRWKFVPAKRGAEPVPAWVLIPISFRLEG